MNESNNFVFDFFVLFFDGRVSLWPKLALLVAVPLYLVSPIDVIPDVFLPFGLADDGGIILAAMFIFVRVARHQLENWNARVEEELQSGNADGVAHSPIYPKQSNWSQVGLGCLAFMSISAFLVFALIALFLFAGVTTLNTTLGGILNIFTSIGDSFGAPTTATVVSSRTIVSKLQPLGQLVTISAEVAQADIFVGVNVGGINLCGHSANHVAHGVVEAGVDITRVGEDSMSYAEDTNTYTLILPEPNITSCRIEYIRQYERSGGAGTCSIDWDSVRLLAQYEATTLFASDTLEAGILDRAKREATLLMQSFVGGLTDSEVNVTYAESEITPELPPSCQPQLPRGWAFDSELNTWVKTG